MTAIAYGSTLTFSPAWLATYRSASPSGMLSNVTVIRAPADPETAATGGTPGDPLGAPGAPWAGAPAGGACAGAPGTEVPAPGGSTGVDGCATCPRGTRRSTMFTPCPDGSFSVACSRRKSIASRIVVSRNSTCGMMMLFSLLVICAVPRVSIPRPLLSAAGPTAPYFRTGCCHASSTFQSCRARVSLYASSPYWYFVLEIRSCPRRAAVLYGSSVNTRSYDFIALSYWPD